MSDPRGPLIRVGSVIIIVALLLYLPTREFLKMTFMLGIPFVLFLVLMKKNYRYSPLWTLSILGLVLTAGFYFYSLTTLPDRIETRRIIMEGERLLADEKYDEAIANYRKLEQTGEIDKMNDRLSRAEAEKEGNRLIQEANEWIAAGDNEKAREILEEVPAETWAAQEAAELMRAMNQ